MGAPTGHWPQPCFGVAGMAALLVLATLAVGCGGPQGPKIRYAHASADELAAAEKEPVVWYEFQPGDEVPVVFGFLGMAEMGSDRMRMVVKRPFWIVVFEDGRTEFSFDGETLDPQPFSRWGMLIGRGENRGSTAVLMYIGPASEAPAELR